MALAAVYLRCREANRSSVPSGCRIYDFFHSYLMHILGFPCRDIARTQNLCFIKEHSKNGY